MHGTREAYNSEGTRNTAYACIMDSLGALQRKVYDCIMLNEPISNREIAYKTGIEINVVCARVYELRGYEKNPLTGRPEINPQKAFVELDLEAMQERAEKKIKPKVCLWRIARNQLTINF